MTVLRIYYTIKGGYGVFITCGIPIIWIYYIYIYTRRLQIEGNNTYYKKNYNNNNNKSVSHALTTYCYNNREREVDLPCQTPMRSGNTGAEKTKIGIRISLFRHVERDREREAQRWKIDATIDGTSRLIKSRAGVQNLDVISIKK